ATAPRGGRAALKSPAHLPRVTAARLKDPPQPTELVARHTRLPPLLDHLCLSDAKAPELRADEQFGVDEIHPVLDLETVGVRTVEGANATVDVVEVESDVVSRQPEQESRHGQPRDAFVALSAPAEHDVIALVELAVDLPYV